MQLVNVKFYAGSAGYPKIKLRVTGQTDHASM